MNFHFRHVSEIFPFFAVFSAKLNCIMMSQIFFGTTFFNLLSFCSAHKVVYYFYEYKNRSFFLILSKVRINEFFEKEEIISAPVYSRFLTRASPRHRDPKQ